MKRRGMTPARLKQAAALCWEDRQTDQEIATGLQIGRRTLTRWKQTPEFQALIRTNMEASRAEMERKQLAEWAARSDPGGKIRKK